MTTDVKLSAMGWDSLKLSDPFKEFILLEGMYKDQFESNLKMIIDDVKNNRTDDIDWDYKGWDELKITWWINGYERDYVISFEGWVFEKFVGTQTMSLDDVIEGAGGSLIVHASDYLKEKENWVREVYNFVMSNLKHAKVE